MEELYDFTAFKYSKNGALGVLTFHTCSFPPPPLDIVLLRHTCISLLMKPCSDRKAAFLIVSLNSPTF